MEGPFLCKQCYRTNLTANDFQLNKQGEKFKRCNRCRENQKIRANIYQTNNKDEINERAREKYKQNREEHIRRVKQWQTENKDKLTGKQICECGSEYTYDHKSRHKKTKKHQKWLSIQ